LARLLRRGVRYLSVRNIDNVGGVLDDRWLAILGRMIGARRRFVVEVSRRPDGPAGKGGALIVRPNGDFELAEDPAFAGTGVNPRESYYINDATAILDVAYLLRIYETSAEELLAASRARLEEGGGLRGYQCVARAPSGPAGAVRAARLGLTRLVAGGATASR